ncbi:MAG: GNAT family N-acetyltransferase [Streptosporangiaceae bacterium]
MSLDVRLVTAEDDLKPELDLADRAFGPSRRDRERRLASARARVAAGRHLGVFDGGTMVASAEFHDMRQWWLGRSLPMAAIAGVKVAPEERGRGVGRALMAGLLEHVAAGGYPLSVLYPATAAVYRSLGWELAGGQYQVEVPARSLHRLLPPDPLAEAGAGEHTGATGPGGRAGGLRRATAADADELMACQDAVHAAGRDCGPVSYPTDRLTDLLDDPDIYCYLAADGMLVYRWNRPDNEVLVFVLVASSAPTTRVLWSILASHGTMVDRVRAFVSPADAVTWLVPEPDVALSRREMWMLRVVDAPAAIAGRGFPERADVDVRLSLADAQRPANSGQWRLEVGAGRGTLTRDGTDAARAASSAPALRLGPRGLAAMYAGTPLAALRRAGLAAGGDSCCDEVLDEAFAGQAYMLDFF